MTALSTTPEPDETGADSRARANSTQQFAPSARVGPGVGVHPVEGDAVTVVDDPRLGRLAVPTVLLTAALAWSPSDLRDLLARYAPTLDPPADTDPVTLAALAAHHAPTAWNDSAAPESPVEAGQPPAPPAGA